MKGDDREQTSSTAVSQHGSLTHLTLYVECRGIARDVGKLLALQNAWKWKLCVLAHGCYEGPVIFFFVVFGYLIK